MAASCGLCYTTSPKTSYVYFRFPLSDSPERRGWTKATIKNNLSISTETTTADGNTTLKIRRRKVYTVTPYTPYFSAYNAGRFGGVWVEAKGALTYGTPGTEEIGSVPNAQGISIWQMRAKDVCGDFLPWSPLAAQQNTSAYQIQMPLAKVTLSQIDYFPSKPTFARATYGTPTAPCPKCPSGWDELVFTAIDKGVPEILVTCSKSCPDYTHCLCPKPDGTVCCYDYKGKAIKSFINNGT